MISRHCPVTGRPSADISHKQELHPMELLSRILFFNAFAGYSVAF